MLSFFPPRRFLSLRDPFFPELGFVSLFVRVRVARRPASRAFVPRRWPRVPVHGSRRDNTFCGFVRSSSRPR